MGSGHFLISAVDKIEEEFEIYRNNRPYQKYLLNFKN